MEAYPPQYVEHNLPFVLVSGLGEEGHTGPSSPSLKRLEYGTRIETSSLECRTEQAQRVLQELRNLDGSSNAWNLVSLPGPPSASLRYKVKAVGRAYTLPARKAAPTAHSPGEGGSPPPRNTELHSPLSPLSPGSPVFPDGVLTPLWCLKHQDQVPALFLAFFNLSANEASQDEQLRNDINAIRGALARSGFKTRFAAILISDRSILHAPDLEDRIGSIRRATALDPKTGLFFMPPMPSQGEVATFVQGMMITLQPSCIEYYRDLTKHARRKKARGGPPPLASTPVGGASQSTSTSGWNVRYEVKQGIFAEFRQEMDIAERNYSAAIEELFSSEGGVLETTASWSPRWDEARLLCDSLALRLLRCQLWVGNTTDAVQSWENYKRRMRDLIDRRGKGSNSYAWDAWEARWARSVAQLIEMANITSLQPVVNDNSADPPVQQFFALPGKAVLPDRLPPWNFLHHSGYWLRMVAKSIRVRWEKAVAIPDEDRVPPGRSPASAVANRWKNYDVYLVPEPHEEFPGSEDSMYDHAEKLATVSMRAAEEFEARQQLHMSEQIRFELAEDLVSAGRKADAVKVLFPLWESSSWREDEWYTPFDRLLRLLLDCVRHDKAVENAALIPVLTWELLSIASASPSDEPPSLNRCLDDWDVDTPVVMTLQHKERLCPVSVAFAFRNRESHVGETQEFQISLMLAAIEDTVPLQLNKLEIRLGARTVVVRHTADESAGPAPATFQKPPLAEEAEDGTLQTKANLTLRSDLKTTLELSVVLREADVFEVAEVTVSVETPKFSLSHRFMEEAVAPNTRWVVENNGQQDSVLIPHMFSKSIAIRPKPPKVRVQLHGLRKQYFTDERVPLKVELVNEELEAITGTITASVINQNGEALAVTWGSGETDNAVRAVTNLASMATDMAELTIHAPPDASTFTLAVELRYTLTSDPATHLVKALALELAFVPAFEAKFIFQSRLHTAPWPSYFDPTAEGTEEASDGIQQLWKLGAQLSSLVDKDIKIHKSKVVIHEVLGDASCLVATSVAPKEQDVSPGKKINDSFELTTRKFSLDDRRPTQLDLSLEVTWSHEKNPTQATSLINVPRLTIPTSEPRVLCTVYEDDSTNDSLILQYHLENPSAHFLTFALTMEASEDFAFSGPKYRTLSLAPLSRHHVDYRILLYRTVDPDSAEVEGYWIIPSLQIVDSYYQKNLRVHPGGERVKLDEKREVNVWVGKSEPPLQAF